MTARLLLLFILGVATGCQGRATSTARTERERDSLLAQSKIPGATGIKRAMAAGDSARSRAMQEDSITAKP